MRYTLLNSEEIKALRKDMKLTQARCADIVGITIRQWSKFENGYPCAEVYIEAIKRQIIPTVKIPISELDIEIFIALVRDNNTEKWIFDTDNGDPVNLIFIKDSEM